MEPEGTHGAPPLALSESLKRQYSSLLNPDLDRCLEAETQTPASETKAAKRKTTKTTNSKSESATPPPVEASEDPPKPKARKPVEAPKPAKVANPEQDAVDASDALDSAKAKAIKAKLPQTTSSGITIVDTRQNVEVEKAQVQHNAVSRGFKLPDTSLLEKPSTETLTIDKDRVVELADRLEKTLADYGVIGKVEEVHPGPTVTTYEFTPQAGTKVSKVASLSDDLALGLSRKVRIIAPIPGKARIGFELPNDERIAVNMRELVEDQRFKKLAEKVPLPVVLGRDIVGAPFYADLAAMPHVIVAGATGAGKSVGLNVMLSSFCSSGRRTTCAC